MQPSLAPPRLDGTGEGVRVSGVLHVCVVELEEAVVGWDGLGVEGGGRFIDGDSGRRWNASL